MSHEGDASALRPCWLVGLSGHRRLSRPEEVGRALIELLVSLRSELDGDLGCVSSIAIGADTLFAEAARRLALPWRALLPAPANEFKTDFDPADWAKAEKLLAEAVEVNIRASAQTKDEAYLECGMDTVDQCDVLIAVWDEQPARGTGGTGEIVAYARSLRKPVIILNSETLTVRREGFDEHSFIDREMNYLNGLPELAAVPPNPYAVPERLVRFFHKVDDMAARIAPNFRRWVASSVVMNTCATILVAMTVSFALHLAALDASVFIMTLGAIGAVVVLKFRRVHEKWIHCRVAAEICRSAMATWEMPHLYLPEVPGRTGVFFRLKTSLRMLHLCSRRGATLSVDELKQAYLARRIDDQTEYHRARALRLASLRGKLITLFWMFSVLAVLRAIFVGAFGAVVMSSGLMHTFSHFLPLVLPCMAGCALALISVLDLNRQLARSRETLSFLDRAREQTAASQNLFALQRAVTRTEQYLAREVADWHTLSEEPRYG